MRLRLFVVAVATSLVALPALAQETSAPPAAPKPEKKVCRSVDVTGSIMGKRICHTKAEWKEFDQLNQANTENALNKRRSDGKPSEL